MNYKDVIKDSKFYLPMNLNLGYLLKDTEIVMLMNVINCDNIHEKLSVRKLMRYTNRSNNTVQNALNTLRDLKLIEGFTPNYNVLKHVFDSLNNAKSIEERIKWCEVYQKSIQQSVSETGTKNVSKTGTQIKKIEKEDLKKKDLNITHNITKDEIETKREFETACGFEIEFDWNDELMRMKARIAKASTVEEIMKISRDFNEKQDSNEVPTELEEELNEVQNMAKAKVYKLKASYA